jgi:hypothetical protein
MSFFGPRLRFLSSHHARSRFFALPLCALAVLSPACSDSDNAPAEAGVSIDAAPTDAALDASDAPPVCSPDLPSDSDCATASPSYEADIAPIFVKRCTVCHSPTGVQAGTLFDTYPRIKADMMQLHVFAQIYNCLMPPPGQVPLTAAERATVLKWFVCDAPFGGDGPPPDFDASDDAGLESDVATEPDSAPE